MNQAPFPKSYYHHLNLSPKELEEIVSIHEQIQIPKGESFIETGQLSQSYLLVESGLLRSFVISTDGKDITTNFFSKGTFALELSAFFLNEPAQESILAVTDCSCWQVTFEDFQRMVRTYSPFSNWGRSWMVRSLIDQKLQTLSRFTKPAMERYLDVARHNPETLKLAPLKHLASFLGITDSSLSRIRSQVSRGNFLP